MTLPAPLPAPKPPRVIDGQRFAWCRRCQQWKRCDMKREAWDVCPLCEKSRLNESAMLPQHSEKANAMRRRMKP